MNKVHIEFQRVQTWLFGVARLRAMVGANAILGRVLRKDLYDLAICSGADWQVCPQDGIFPDALLDDPLAEDDSPRADAQHGILSRDGGHFEASFTGGAEAFVASASRLLWHELPGLGFKISIDGVTQPVGGDRLVSPELPILAPCDWTGKGIASKTVRQGDESVQVSVDVLRRHEAAKAAEDGSSQDTASRLILRTKMAPPCRRPKTFAAIAGDSYLAVIHADGNGVGAKAPGDEAQRAAFFHRNRVLLRRALKYAIDAHCTDVSISPLVPLMLGGDDLLVVCHAPVALPFVVDLCAELERIQSSETSEFHLTLGIGVVIAKHTIPFHRLHEVAENLAASAKRQFRGRAGNTKESIVDWAVYTTSWIDDPTEQRRREWIRGTNEALRILSRRPMSVLGDSLNSLQGIVSAAGRLKGAPRGQLHYLLEQLPMGRNIAELAFEELSPETRQRLNRAGVQSVWQALGEKRHLTTSLLDLIEVSEIRLLGESSSVTEGDDELEEEVSKEVNNAP